MWARRSLARCARPRPGRHRRGRRAHRRRARRGATPTRCAGGSGRRAASAFPSWHRAGACRFSNRSCQFTADSVSPSGCCRLCRSWWHPGWPTGSGYCARWCSPTCPRACSSQRWRSPRRSGQAVVLLLARTVLSQMDVPTRQTYVMALVEPAERTPAAAYTNTAATSPGRSVRRSPRWPRRRDRVPVRVAGGIKAVYDVTLWRWFRRVALRHDREGTGVIVRLRTVDVPTGEWGATSPGSPRAARSEKRTAYWPSSCPQPTSGTSRRSWSRSGLTTPPSTPGSPPPTRRPHRLGGHQAVDYHPITRYDLTAGYVNHPPLPPPIPGEELP